VRPSGARSAVLLSAESQTYIPGNTNDFSDVCSDIHGFTRVASDNAAPPI
jgi:hypothetical protein